MEFSKTISKEQNQKSFLPHSYHKKLNNNGIKDDYIIQLTENNLKRRKEKMQNLLLSKRLANSEIFNDNKNNSIEEQLKQISILIYKNTPDEIDKGLNLLNNFFIQNEINNKEIINYIIENIFYRLLDLIKSNKSFENNIHMEKIIYLINFLTTYEKKFILILTQDISINLLNLLILENNNNERFIFAFVPLISDLLTEKERFFKLVKIIDIVNFIKNCINIHLNTSNNAIENFLILINNFIINIPEDYTPKCKFILKYVLTVFTNNFKSLYDNNSILAITSIFDILIHFESNKENNELIANNNLLLTIKNIISRDDTNITYKIKCFELLCNIIKASEDFSSKKIIISVFYDLNKEIPFCNELVNYISLKNYPIINILIRCICSLCDKCIEFSELYFLSNDFIQLFINLFETKSSRKTKNEILICLIEVIGAKNIKIYNFLIKNKKIFSVLLSYLNKKIKSKKNVNKIIIYNIIYLINLFLELKQNDNFIFDLLEEYKFKNILESLIKNKDEDICSLSRNIFIQYYSENENMLNEENEKNKNNEIKPMDIE